MSASAIANHIQYQDAFANKKLQQKQQKPQYEGTGALNSHPFDTKSSDNTNVNKARLEDPFVNDNDSGYLSNATYNKSEEDKEDALDDQSIYSTPLGKSQKVEAAADTPIPSSASQNNPKSGDAPSKDFDDYDKVVKVIHDHISKELPKMPESVEGQKQECCCGHKAAAEKSAAAADDEKKGSAEQESAEEKAVAVESEGSGKEEKDEGDGTVIVTLKATEPAENVEDKKKDEASKTEDVEKKE